MANITPNIICHIEAHQYYSEPPKRNSCRSDKDFNIKTARFNKTQFYRCNGSGYDILKYLERPEAIEKSDSNLMERILEVEQINEFGYDKKDILNYADLRPGSTGVFSKNSSITNKEIRENLRTTKSTIWSGVLSFTESYANQFCTSKNDAQKLMNETLETLFISQGLDPKNVSYFCAFHNNKGKNVLHPHIHFIYWENEPTKLNSKGELSYSKFMVPKKAIYDFKYQVANYHNSLGKTKGPELMFDLRDGIKNSFKVRSLEEQQYERWMKLDKDLGENRSSQFARLNKEQRNIIRDFITEIISHDSTLSEMWNKYNEELNKKFMEIKSLHKENNMPLSKAAKTYCKSRIDDLYSRCGNTVLKSLSIICEVRKKLELENEKKLITKSNKYKLNEKSKKNNPLLIQGNIQTKVGLYKFITAIISQQTKDLHNDINKELSQFYKALKERGDISIYE